MTAIRCARCKRVLAHAHATAGGLSFGPVCAEVVGAALAGAVKAPKVRAPSREELAEAEFLARQKVLWPEMVA